MGINLKGMTRKSAIDAVGALFSDPGVANFVTNNIVYEGEDEEQRVEWCINLEAIKNNVENLANYNCDGFPYLGPTYFINGVQSF
jgi:hypothetical protein